MNTPANIPPRAVRLEEFPALLRLLNRVFGANVAPGIEQLYPTFFRPIPEALDDLRIISVDGAIVAHVGFETQTVRIGDATLKLGFLGAVATDPAHRDHGYASVLMKDAIRQMREKQIDFSLLGGLRYYYERFGYEMGGAEYSFLVFPQGIRGLRAECAISPYRGTDKELEKVHASHAREPLRVQRTPADYRLLLGVPDRNVYCAEKGDQFAYAVLGKPRWTVGDLRQTRVLGHGGPCELVMSLFHHLLNKEGYQCLWVSTPASAHPLRDRLLRSGQEYYLGPIANLRVVHLCRLLEKMAPSMSQRLAVRSPVRTGAITIAVTDADGLREEATLCVHKEAVAVDRDAHASRIEVDSLRLVQLLYGLDVPSRWCPWLEPEAARLLDQVFPLDLHVAPFDHV